MYKYPDMAAKRNTVLAATDQIKSWKVGIYSLTYVHDDMRQRIEEFFKNLTHTPLVKFDEKQD